MTLSQTTDKRFRMQIVAEPDVSDFFKALCAESGLSQGLAIRIHNELLTLVVGAAKERAIVDPETTASALELYVGLTFRSLGLLTDDEFNRYVLLCERGETTQVEKRLKVIEEIANERLETLRPIWEQSREQFYIEKSKRQPVVMREKH